MAGERVQQAMVGQDTNRSIERNELVALMISFKDSVKVIFLHVWIATNGDDRLRIR